MTRKFSFRLRLLGPVEGSRGIVLSEVLKFRRGNHGQPWAFLNFARGKGTAIVKEDSYGDEHTKAEREEQWVPGVASVEAEPTIDGRIVLKFRDGAFRDPFIGRHVSDGTIRMFAYLLLLRDLRLSRPWSPRAPNGVIQGGFLQGHPAQVRWRQTKTVVNPISADQIVTSKVKVKNFQVRSPPARASPKGPPPPLDERAENSRVRGDRECTSFQVF